MRAWHSFSFHINTQIIIVIVRIAVSAFFFFWFVIFSLCFISQKSIVLIVFLFFSLSCFKHEIEFYHFYFSKTIFFYATFVRLSKRYFIRWQFIVTIECTFRIKYPCERQETKMEVNFNYSFQMPTSCKQRFRYQNFKEK